MTKYSKQSKLAAFVVVAAGAVMGVSLGSSGANNAPHAHAGHPHDQNADALDYAVGNLSDRYESASAIWVERNLADLLPNRKFAIEGATPRRLSSGIVVGTVTRVIGGAGYAVDGDADNGTVVAFDSEDALWRVAELTVSVAESFGTEGETEVRVALPFDGREDSDAFLQAFTNQHVIIALAPKGAVQHDPTLYSIAHGGGAIGFVSDQGQISLPVIGEEH